MVIYAMSDMHGELELFNQALEWVDLSDPDSRLILLGDYIDGGPQSGGTLRRVWQLQQEYGPDRVVALKGNHEADLLDWLEVYGGPGGPAGYSGWLHGELSRQSGTLGTLLTTSRWVWLRRQAGVLSEDALNLRAARMVLEANGPLMDWLRALPCCYETERQIFVHAGVDEEAGALWRPLTEEYVLLGKFPASTGAFYKDIVAGHVSSAAMAGDPDFHRVFWDGQSHYYIDGSTVESRCLPVLKYDGGTGRYTQIIGGVEEPVT